jgi:hypothetical protein
MTVALYQATYNAADFERLRRVGSERSSVPRDDLYRTFRDLQFKADRSGKLGQLRLDKDYI